MTDRTTEKLKVGGVWSGVLDVDMKVWTLPMLRQEICRRLNCSLECINLIYAGKVLRDGNGDETLLELGLKNNAKILATRTSVDNSKSTSNEFLPEEERAHKLSRIRDAANALATRHGEGLLPMEDFNIELEDQSGKPVKVGSENDQKGIMMGLMLHANAKSYLREQRYRDALDVLSMAEEAFSLCNPKFLEMIDNVSILQIDMVWCYFMLQDISCLSMAGMRLAQARKGLELSHGKDSSRLKRLQEGRNPEIALYLKLELLEGVVAYHNGLYNKSHKSFTSAQARHLQLQVPDESLSLLIGMGYEVKEAKQALRMSNHDVQSAINFLIEEKEKKALRYKEDIQRQKEIREQKKYGMTPLKKPVDLQLLDNLVSIGFEKLLAAEALRRNENDTQKALDDLTNPETNSILQLYIESKKLKKTSKSRSQGPLDSDVEKEIIAMGFERSRVIDALDQSDTKEKALSILLGELGSSHVALDADSVHSRENQPESSNSRDVQWKRDEEMEEVIAQEITGDPLSDYDIDVTKEGEAIVEYLSLLSSKGIQ